ncbi:hypothetical protein HOK68_02385 [Candidatus Woesearchaeota archaeon]|jgi:DNA-directed RNA polymerase subunit A"|nr:hypothetical protein [Candidatus Woesearchaeota archaeon]MBT4387845.1 hypothetical protein [Candidatus Woesearchaeota archaeon]MBT4595664.1 hypothetical protein [Candidatus Woesearchaeota archaeon]MBT5740853.1 hypothetical protein [Candidatus Woesearchaeota archaeon]MBT6505602.1 hypothetical protein [Candidatus Woesearchaeota archaeon]
MEDLIKKYEKKLSGKIISDIKLNVPKNIDKKKLEEIFKRAVTVFENAQIDTSEACGLIASSSFGEQSTQMTLNEKHGGGTSTIQLSSGLPRIIEIFDGRKELSTPMMEIFFKKKKLSENEVKNYAMHIKETKLIEFIEEFQLDFINQVVKCYLNKDKLKKEKYSQEAIAKALQKNMKGIIVEEEEEYISVKKKIKDEKIMDLYKLKDKLKNVFVSGIKNISQVVIVQEDDGSYKILTRGSSLKHVLELDFIDPYKTTTNDIWQICNHLGIEAARAAIIKETDKVLEVQGLNINIRHSMLIADTMSLSGIIKGITRFGILLDKDSVISKASFETPMKHIFNAAISGQKDKLKSVMENVMVNQPIPIGTGMGRLLAKEDS